MCTQSSKFCLKNTRLLSSTTPRWPHFHCENSCKHLLFQNINLGSPAHVSHTVYHSTLIHKTVLLVAHFVCGQQHKIHFLARPVNNRVVLWTYFGPPSTFDLLISAFVYTRGGFRIVVRGLDTRRAPGGNIGARTPKLQDFVCFGYLPVSPKSAEKRE